MRLIRNTHNLMNPESINHRAHREHRGKKQESRKAVSAAAGIIPA